MIGKILRKNLAKAGIAAFGLASFAYTGCCTAPKRILEEVRIEKKSAEYAQSDKYYEKRVHLIDKKFKKHNHPEKIDLEILVDGNFINQYNVRYPVEGWWGNFYKCMESVNSRFKQRFGIEFDVDSVKYLKLPENIPRDLGFMLFWMRLYHKPEQFDAFVFLSGERFRGGQGVARPNGNHTVIAPAGHHYYLERILQHELSHLFEAKDIRSSDTIMSNGFFSFSYEWGEANANIIQCNSRRVWYFHDRNLHRIKKIISGFPAEDQAKAAELCSYANAFYFHPEGLNLSDEMLKKYPDSQLVRKTRKAILNLKKAEAEKN